MRRLALLGALLFAAPLAAQGYYTLPFSSQAIASTFCVSADSNVVTLIDVSVLGTDSLDEFLAHEAAHRAQMRDSLQAVGHCPGPFGDRRASMIREVMAYCISDSVRELRTHDPAEADSTTVTRLIAQYWGEIGPITIIDAWHRGCPRYARKS